MGQDEDRTITEILHRLDDAATPDARSELWDLVYGELHGVASRLVRREVASATLHPTALVSEAYLRLFGGQGTPSWSNRAHFFGTAIRAMRQLLIERVRRQRRGGGAAWRVTLDPERDGSSEGGTFGGLELVESIDSLEREDPRAAEVVMLRLFAGLSHDDVAQVLGVSVPTVKRDWAFGRAWLYDQLVPEAES